ncbi:lysophospholipid acyltransferase family protein [Chryseolinea sp. H1M3-3]|uniref:lysophospholipid acyltransferase family protein n=1 Tax=Chryseolinea sp. H1M3-3 TaxID=3034144 RepID=UPI0023EB20CA|nr:lysophospholipid acyltransferase family protein [Chryseolinea sp. H1M3-3]
MKILRVIHTGYGLIVFTTLFIMLLPFLVIPILFPSQFQLVGIINRWWARLMFTFIFIPFQTEYRSKLDPKRQYIFCPNHFSYLDIPALGLSSHNTIFVGKSEMAKVPLFGFMYGKLHITVDRTKLKSRYASLEKSFHAIDQGKSLVIYPEGGIVTEKEPVLSKFKDGAFRVAIEKQIAIVPVTIPFNWIILPPDEFLLRWHPLKVIFHEPIETSRLTIKDVDALKERVFTIIDSELKKNLNTEILNHYITYP